jgi:hypothetical protein
VTAAKIANGTLTDTQIASNAAIAYSKLNLASSIVNADVAAGAAIAYSKLNLSNSIVNGDIAAGANIAYSKLNLANSIVNADVAAGANIAYSKLNLANSIVNADIASGAGIAFSKLASLSTGQIIAGNAGTPTAVTLSGDATINGSGVLTIANNAITTAKIADDQVTAAKLAPGAVESAMAGSSSGANVDNGATNFLGFGMGIVSPTESTVQMPMPTAGTVTDLHILLSGDPGASPNQYAFAVMKNGVATSVTCTVGTGATSCSDSANTVSFVAGDLISLRSVPTSNPTARSVRFTASLGNP